MEGTTGHPVNGSGSGNGNGSGASGAPRKLVKKKKAGSSLFMSTNNRSQAHWQNQQLKRPAAFQELEPGKGRGGAGSQQQQQRKAQQATEQIKIPHLATQLKDLPANERVSGFSDPALNQAAAGQAFRDYKLVTTKRELLHSLRHHLMQLAGSNPPDLLSEEFTKPARLYRRNINAELVAQPESEVKPDTSKSELDAEQKVELLNRKEQRAREREANLAQVAPSTNTAKKTNNFKGVQQVFRRTDFTEEDKRLIQTNYEEAVPWVLEDYDAKHTYVGRNHLGAFGVHVGFAYEPGSESKAAHFRLIPIEKTYEFRPKPKVYNTMSIEDIMKAMKRGAVDPAWLKEYEYRRRTAEQNEKDARQARRLYTGESRGRSTNVYNHRRSEDADLDFEEDFADDEEGNLFGDDEDEDEKDVKKRVKEEQLQANFFNNRDEAEDDLEEQLEERQAEARRRFGKDYRKALERREGNYNHGSDSETMTETDSEEERQRLEQQEKAKNKKEEEGAGGGGGEGKKSAGGLSSGGNTPSGRKEKHGSGRDGDETASPSSRSKSKSRKRPGSPNLSDASGTDASTRRKKRKSHHNLLSPSSQPTPGPSRPRSPEPAGAGAGAGAAPQRPGLQSRTASMAAGSDTDGGGGATTDATRAPSIKLKLKKEHQSSAPPSRSGSPIPRPLSTGPSNASANNNANANSSQQQQQQQQLPTPEEISRALPAGGISYKDLLNVFPALRTNFRNPATKPDVLRRVKAAGQTQAGRVYPFGEQLPLVAGSAGAGSTPTPTPGS